MYLKEEVKKQPSEDLEEILNFFQNLKAAVYGDTIIKVTAMIKDAGQLIFIGLGISGILGQYGARYFSNPDKYSQYIENGSNYNIFPTQTSFCGMLKAYHIACLEEEYEL